MEQDAAALQDAPTLDRCREIEAAAANLYFGGWAGRVRAQFASRDLAKVPTHWLVFGSRRSVLQSGKTPRRAATPINALLNYGYALAEAECRIATLVVGLDPGLGLLHADRKARDSLVLDLLEPLRPLVEAQVLRLLAVRHLRYTDFRELPDGTCRLLAPLTHELAVTMPQWARAIAPIAEQVAHALARSSCARIELRTPLTQANVRATQRRSVARVFGPPEPGAVLPGCHMCGLVLTDRRRKLCAGCWSVERRRLAAERAEAGRHELRRRRLAGDDPSQSVRAAVKRRDSLVRNRAGRDRGAADTAAQIVDLDLVLAGLVDVPLSRIAQATELSISACSRIRNGHLRPHQRHWAALAKLAIAGPSAGQP